MGFREEHSRVVQPYTAVLFLGNPPPSGLPCAPTFLVSSRTVPYLVNFGGAYFFLGVVFTGSSFPTSRLRG